ncbi:MAG: inositol monophosphatase family protein [candidate division NC10 bacterium]|nr:inositol monophosphatase family protein [candidate division NC10 bacterium]
MSEGLQDHLLSAIQASLKAGQAILDIYDSDFAVQMKGDRTPLTLADERSHAILSRGLGTSGIPILSEEGKDIPYEERRGWNRLWIVDPLDGTKEFIKKNGEFTVNIALVEGSQPVLGVIHAPAMGLLYFAAQGLGSFKLSRVEEIRGLDGISLKEIISHSLRLPLSSSPPRLVPAMTHKRDEPNKPDERDERHKRVIIIGSRSHATPELAAYVEEKRREYGEVEFISAGSSLKFCLVAEGSADIYPRLGPTMEWDTAAGQAIAENAGREVLVWQTGGRLRYNRDELLNPWFVVR